MSFFSNLQQMVTSGVDKLNISAKRFTLSRDSSTESAPSPPTGTSASSTAASGTTNVASAAGGATSLHQRTRAGSLQPQHTGPKVIPSPSCSRTLSRCNLDPPMRRPPVAAIPAPLVYHRTTSPIQQTPKEEVVKEKPIKPILPLSTRKSSCLDGQGSASGVQEADGSYFESFSALPWKQENRRLQAISDQEQQSDQEPPTEASLGIRKGTEPNISKKEWDQMYVEVLYTITNKIGATPGRYTCYKDNLYYYAQESFAMPQDQHRRLLVIASEEKAPIVVLNVVVAEAEGLEAKDPNGFSDPYCMLGIQPGSTPPPLPSPSPPPRGDTPPGSPSSRGRGPEDEGDSGLSSSLDSPRERLRKHHSFRLSFKRREGGGDSVNSRRGGGVGAAGHRDSLSFTVAVPAKFIRATTVRPHTLNPRWNEKFRFDIDDVDIDILHLDIWDHDDESSVLECVSKLNEVRGVKGLGRFFKQIAQSARSGSQDDFLGSVNVPLQNIPSTGSDDWYELEGRSQRSAVQGRLRLKLWLSTREDRGVSEEEEDHWIEIRQQELFHHIFIQHELKQFKGPSSQWSGDLPPVALSILHQHAIQGDVTDLQRAMIRWAAFARQATIRPLDHRILMRLLAELEERWPSETLSREEEEFLSDAFSNFIRQSILRLRKHRQLFPPGIKSSMHQLEFMLRCLSYISEMNAYRKCCPFHKEIRSEIVQALRKGSMEWYVHLAVRYEDAKKTSGKQEKICPNNLQSLIRLSSALSVDVQMALDCYSDLFESTCKISYFNIIYRQHEKTLADDIQKQMETVELQEDVGPMIEDLCMRLLSQEMESVGIPDGVDPGTAIFELFLAVQEFTRFRDHLPNQERKATLVSNYHNWFAPAVARWLAIVKLKAVNRIHRALELEMTQDQAPELIGSAALDTTSCFYQIREFWRHLAWPHTSESLAFIARLLDVIGYSTVYYANVIHQKLQDSGYYEETNFQVNQMVSVTLNSLEHVHSFVITLPVDLQIDQILAVAERCGGENGARWQQYDRNTILQPLEDAVSALDARIEAITSHFAMQLKAPLKKSIFHLAWSPDSLPTEEAVRPLLSLLTAHLTTLGKTLLPNSFHRVLPAFWDALLNLLREQANADGVQDKTTPFYERLHGALLIISDFLHADNLGLSKEELHTPLYQQVEQVIVLHKTSTEMLTDMYHMERLQEQAVTEYTEYGYLSVRVYFHHDSLSVEVISARDLVPLDPNGLSDPFVILELLPRRVFAQCPDQQTAIQKKTLFPLFDECFEFSVTSDQCLTEGAMLLFTVMDHDVLTTNDFEGEVFLPLCSLPGVTDSATSVDNLHGLKALDLPLMQQKNKNHPIIITLEQRIGDKVAQDFVKKQRRRIALNAV